MDVLTLSATPIPRTLYFAMVGARSFSAIETAPSERRPIRTEVVKNNKETIKRAIDNEIRRGEQVFYLHNRVKTIDLVAKKLSQLYPKIKDLHWSWTNGGKRARGCHDKICRRRNGYSGMHNHH